MSLVMAVMYWCVVAAVALPTATVMLALLLRAYASWITRRKLKGWGLRRQGQAYRPVIVGFFHPYCNAGGGGERVLWQSIRALQKRYSFVNCVVYTGDVDAQPRAILTKAQQCFGVTLVRDVKFVYLRKRWLVEPETWPRFTLLGQSLGSMFLGLSAFFKFLPHLYVDSMGYPFTAPLFKWLGGCRVASYVHYPVVSRDMLQLVSSKAHTYNNASWIAHSRMLTCLKLCYYKLFARLYGFVGRRSDVVMVNSSWTYGHIKELWGHRRVVVAYPPCDLDAFLSLSDQQKPFRIVSVGQFRPEKHHALQLEVLAELLQQMSSAADKNELRLVMVGGCRNLEDERRVSQLKERARELAVDGNVEFKVNVSFEELRRELAGSCAALHTMWNEHFGISVVECMAAGCVTVAHDSGGPALDIIVEWNGQRTGYLAQEKEDFVSCLLEALYLHRQERLALVAAARGSVQSKFSVEAYETAFLRATEHLVE